MTVTSGECPGPRPKHYATPVLPLDYPLSTLDGALIWPCDDCLPWHIEVVDDPATGSPIVREWHSVGCAIWDA